MEQSGKTLSLLGNDVWRGGYTHNGTLLKLHDFSLTKGYSQLNIHTGGKVFFGYGVWYDANDSDNQVYSRVADTTTPVFAGIVVRQAHIASGYPARNDEVTNDNKGLIAKRGFVVYKKGFAPAVLSTGGTVTTPATEQGFSDIQIGMTMFIAEADGKPVFGASGAYTTGYQAVGKIVSIDPDQQSWTVEITG